MDTSTRLQRAIVNHGKGFVMKTSLVNQKIIVSIFAVTSLIYGAQGISYGNEEADTVVEFSDRRLALRVRRALGLPTGDGVDLLKIPKTELEKLTALNAGYSYGLGYRGKIDNLTGLEHATQLEVLYLDDNNISDITPLAQLTQLETLDLDDNNISDITPLAQLTQLETLDLDDNNISDITPLAQLTQLEALVLRSNSISDITPLAQLTQLEALVLRSNSISDITPLAQLTQLETLDLRYNYSISDVTPLAQLTQLETLDLRYNYSISDITPLLGLISLKTLRLSGNPIDSSALIAYLDANPDVDLDIAQYIIREEGGPTITASTSRPLTGTTLDYASVTLTLSSGSFLEFGSDIGEHLTISGIPGIGAGGVNRVSNKKITFSLRFNRGAITADSILTLTVGPGAIRYYNGPAPTVQIPVKGVTEAELAELSQAVVASTPYPLTEATLNGSIVTLRLTSGVFRGSNDSRYEINDIKVSGISGVTIARNVVHKVSDTEITVELRFSGIINTDTTLIFTVADFIRNYNGPPRTAEIPVSATTEVEPTGELVASSSFPLTKATLDGSFVVLTLQNDSYSYKGKGDEAPYYLRQVGISGIRHTQTGEFASDKYAIRLSRTEILVQIDFQGDFDTDVTLTFTVPPSLIENYNGPPLAAELSVTVETGLRVLITEFQQHSMYWINTDTDKIESVAHFDAVTQGVESLTVDTVGGKLYWGERSSSGGVIKRANYDGTNVEALVSLSSIPRGIAIDAVGNQIYWTNSDLQIQTANLNGEDIRIVSQLEEEIVEETVQNCGVAWFILPFVSCSTKTILINLTSPTDIAVNTADGRLYWTELSGRIRRVNLDGTNVDTLVSDLGNPYGIAVADGKVYWAEEIDKNSGKIQRANLNGTNIETLATVYGIPLDISVDTASGQVYWANSLGGIQRMDLNGGEVEPVASGITVPGDFVLVPGAQQTTPTTAATDATVSISPASVAFPAVGEQIEFAINIADGEAVAGYQATVQFDTTTLRYVSGANGDFLPADAFFVPPVINRNRVTLNATSLAGESSGDGTLAALTFEAVSVKASTLTLSEVLLVSSDGESYRPKVEDGQITAPSLDADVNGDGTVNIQDLVLVASNIGQTGQNAADTNGDGLVNIVDLVLVAGALGSSAAAPSLHSQSLAMPTAAEIRLWLSNARQLNLTDATSLRGILFLEQLLAALIPKETALLPNYPNPFNPETWIPYHLAEAADVTLTIYDTSGQVVRQFPLGHQAAGRYQTRSRAIHWGGRNEFGEQVASGVYFYHLSAGDFSATRKMLVLK